MIEWVGEGGRHRDGALVLDGRGHQDARLRLLLRVRGLLLRAPITALLSASKLAPAQTSAPLTPLGCHTSDYERERLNQTPTGRGG